MKFILLFILFPLLLSLVSLVFLLTGTYINIDIISSYIAWTIVPTITVFLSYKIASLLFKKSRAALITFILTVIYTILTVVYIMPAFKNASMKAKQMEASTTLSSLIKSSGAYVKEYGKLPVSTKDLGEYMNISGCTKNNSKFCKTEIPPIDYSNIHRTMWFSPTGNYKYEIKNSNNTIYFLAKPTGDIQDIGYGVRGYYDKLSGTSRLTELSFKGAKFGINDINDSFHLKQKVKEYEKEYLICLERTKSTSNKSLKKIQENYCETTRADEMIKQMQKENRWKWVPFK